MRSLQDMVLLPRPRQVAGNEGTFVFDRCGIIVYEGPTRDLLGAARQVQGDLRATQGRRWEIAAADDWRKEKDTVRIGLGRGRKMPAQGYRLEIAPDRIEILARDPAGAFYGAITLRQLLRQCRGELPAGRISDSPDFPVRGVMLDVSRDKVPTLETLFRLVDRLAEWKINHLQLYTEHTFAYRNHREVWAQASPITGEEVLRLDAYCRERYVELAPNQNSFGHFHRWLQLPGYIHLAECPDGFHYPWGEFHPGPFSLDPTNPKSLALLDELYSELLPYFSSRKLNVGCDETFDLGLGRSRGVCEAKGKGRVYLDFLLQIHRLVRKHGRTMHFWGDIIVEHPELVPEVPRDVVVLVWGYEAECPFAEQAAKLAASGIPFYVCPGTSSWNSIAGRTDNAIGNLRSAAISGVEYGAAGYLITDWGDSGHWQYLPVSYPGYAAGAAFSWNAAGGEPDWAAALNTHVFEDEAAAMGPLAYDLGNAYLHTGYRPFNASVLFQLLQWPPAFELPETVTVETLRRTRAYVEEVAVPLARVRMKCPDAARIREEYANVTRLLLHACDRGTAIFCGRIETPEVRRCLDEELQAIVREHRRLWLARNRPGGLEDSVRRMEKLLWRDGQDRGKIKPAMQSFLDR